MKLIECVPNFSEGRRSEVIDAIRDAIAAVPWVSILDVSSDPSHNRTVVTFVAPPETVGEAAFAGIREAAARIDLTKQEGEHPRIGAADVVPFVPLEGATMEECIAIARRVGDRVGTELEIPVYLYEHAATRDDRRNLADVRRGEFEGLRDAIASDPARAPDFGPARVHPTAGAVAIGARPVLVAFNVYLGPAANLGVARAVARAVRGSSGGLANVKALALEVNGQAQVSMNLVDIDRTPAHLAFELVCAEAAAHGVAVTWSELVGLIPERVLRDAGARHLRLFNLTPDAILERRIREAALGGPSVREFLADVAEASPTPGGGSAAALAGALAAALGQMVAGLTLDRPKYAEVEEEMRALAAHASRLRERLQALVAEDARAYGAVDQAFRMPADGEKAVAARAAAMRDALLHAAEVPLEVARCCADVAELAAACAARGNRNATADAAVAALLADAAARGAAYNVRINVATLANPSDGAALSREAAAEARRASDGAAAAAQAMETRLA